jgi:Family of unknown function (DUF6188)
MLWPLKADIDLSFLVGQKLIQIAIGLYQVQFRFDQETSISVEDCFTYERAEKKHCWKSGELEKAGPVVELVGSVVNAVLARDSEVEIRFSNGSRLALGAEPSALESFTIRHRGGLMVV